LAKPSPQEELSDAALRLQTVIETAIDGIITIDEKGRVETFNSAAAQLFGYKPEEVIGQNVKILMPSPFRQKHDQYMENYRQTHEAKIIGIGREVVGMKKDGTTFPMRLSVGESLLFERRIFTGIIHDLSEVKAAEEEIRKLNEELEEKVIERTEELASVVNKLLNTNKQLQYEVQERKSAEKALRESELETRKSLQKEKELSELKSRFVSMASHEFRTPLSTILSSVTLLARYKEAEQQPKREKHINRIKSAVRNLTGILNDFLSLSKLEEGKVEVEPSSFELRSVTPEIIDEIEGLLKPGQEIILEPVSENVEFYSDKRLLKNILFNLFSNAIKYSGEGKKIFCREKIDGTNIIFEVEDQGIGIPESEHHNMFTRFFRAGNATNIQGTGLGLTIVKQYLDLLGGDISFTSEVDRGTTFTVTLPIKLKQA
jgi:two-component system sensor kinase FixL